MFSEKVAILVISLEGPNRGELPAGGTLFNLELTTE
jgi:hypothetical protein